MTRGGGDPLAEKMKLIGEGKKLEQDMKDAIKANDATKEAEFTKRVDKFIEHIKEFKKDYDADLSAALRIMYPTFNHYLMRVVDKAGGRRRKTRKTRKQLKKRKTRKH